jgi:hypothetical protein
MPFLLCVAMVLGMPAGAQQKPFAPPSTVKDQAQAARILREGPDDLRVDAQIRITITPAAQRTPATWRAVSDEVARIVACEKRNPENPRSIPGCALAGGSENAYFEDVVDILSEWPDPAAIPSLLLVVDSGGTVAHALARFGDLALPDLLRLARQDRSSGAMFALSRMLQLGPEARLRPLSQGGRRQVLQFAQEAMRQIGSRGVIPVVNLALATGDEGLRKDLGQLASDADEWRRRGLIDQEQIERAMGQVRAQLRPR